MANQQQLDIETQINKAIQARSALMQSQKGVIADQIALAQELCRAMECKELEGYNERLKETREGLLKAADAIEEVEDNQSRLAGSLKKSSKGFSMFKGIAVGSAVAAKNAFGMVFNIVKGVGNLVSTVIVGAFKMVKFVINGWSAMLGNMAQKGMEAGNAGIALRNAYEEVKFTLGGLGSKEGKAVTDTFDRLRRGSGGVAKTGIKFSKIFGRGPDGAAKALEYLLEMAEQFGPSLDRMSSQMAGAADEMILLSKSLGFTGEDFEKLGVMAGYTGETLKQTLGRLSKEIVTTSKQLGVNSKVMADNLKIMLKSPLVYGTSTKEMLKTSVAAQKLGVSIEQLQGPMSIFDDFESAATNAADLAAEFGVMVDATEMMSADPADQFTMLKDAINASGRSFEDMSRQERRRLAELSGYDADALFKSMDPSNAFDKSASDTMEKGVDKATAATLSQAKATKVLSKQMKKLHESMSPMNTQGGFFGTFVQGMQEGLLRSKEGREMIMAVTRAFKAVHRAGREVGRMMADLFKPGAPLHFLYDYFMNLESRIKEAMPKVKAAFGTFIADLTAGGEQAANALSNLLMSLKDTLFKDSGVLSGLIAGFHAVADLIVANLIKLVPYILEGMIKMMEGAIALMSGEAPAFAKNLETGAIMPMAQKAFAGLLKDDVIDKFGKTFMKMLNKFNDKFGKQILDMFKDFMTAVFVGALIQAAAPMLIIKAVSTAVGGLVKGVGAGLAGAFGGGSQSASWENGGLSTDDVINGTGGGDKSIIDKLKETIDKIADIDRGKLVKAMGTLAIIGGGFATGVIGLALLAVAFQKTGVQPEMLAAVALAFGAMAALIIAINPIVKATQTLPKNPATLGKAALTVAAVGLLFTAVLALTVSAMGDLAGMASAASDGGVGMKNAAEAAGMLAITALVVTAGILALGGILAAVMAALTNPVTAALLVAALAGASLVFIAVMGLVKSSISSFAKMTPAQGLAAKQSAEAIQIVMNLTFRLIDKIWTLMKGVAWDPIKFHQILSSVKQIINTLTCKMVPIIMSIAATFTADPKSVKAKIETIVLLISAFDPITNMMTAAMAIKDAKPKEIALMLGHITEGFSMILKNVKGMVRGILKAASGLSESEIKSANVAATVLGAVSTMIGSLMPKGNIFEDTVKDTFSKVVDIDRGFISATYSERLEKSGEQTTKKAVDKQVEYVNLMVNLLSKVGTPLEQLVKAVGAITFEGDAKTIEKNMKTTAIVLESVGTAGRSIEAMTAGMRGVSGAKKGALTSVDFARLRDFFVNTRDLLVGDKRTGAVGIIAIGADMAMTAGQFITQFNKSSLKNLGNILEGFDKITQIGTLVNALAPVAKNAATSFETITALEGKFTKAAVQPLIDMITAYNYLYDETNKSLENMGDLNAVLKQVGDTLSLTDDEITIKTEQINLEIKLNVTLDTKNIARALVEGEFVQADEALRSRLDIKPKGAR